jgi:hypothetical protein
MVGGGEGVFTPAGSLLYTGPSSGLGYNFGVSPDGLIGSWFSAYSSTVAISDSDLPFNNVYADFDLSYLPINKYNGVNYAYNTYYDYICAFDSNSTLYLSVITTGAFGSIPPNTPLIIGLNRYYGPNHPLNPVPVPVPYITSVQQRTNSPLIDIDYTVNDAATSQVTTAMVAFNNGSEDFNHLVHMAAFAENTGTNLGPNIAANVSHRVTWDASEGTTNFASFQFDILARDQRPLLNIHFITVPATTNQPAFTMSSGGVEDTSLFNIWLWLLATNNPSITLTNGAVVGVGGAYDQQTLASGTSTTAAGRQFLYPLLNFGAPTSAENTAAQSGNYGFINLDGNNVIRLP